MVDSFKFASNPSIVFGSEKFKTLPDILRTHYGKSVLIITGAKSFAKSEHWSWLLEQLRGDKLHVEHYKIEKEPDPEIIDGCVRLYRDTSINCVVGIGGGSVMDAGKAISAMLKHPLNTREYLEGVGSADPTGDKVPFIAIPTTSGTGSEATKNAVISEVGDNGFKKSLRHDRFIPDMCIVDPELTLSCPKAITASSGMDAFTQLLESYLSTNANPITDALSLEAMRILIKALPASIRHGDDLGAREGMSYASMISGITLANAGLGLVHGFASSIGGFFDIPHGVVCGTLMSEVNRMTVDKLRRTPASATALKKYDKVAGLFTDFAEIKGEDNRIDAFMKRLGEWTEEFELPLLGHYGITKKDIPKIVEASGNKYNPAHLNEDEMGQVLSARL